MNNFGFFRGYWFIAKLKFVKFDKYIVHIYYSERLNSIQSNHDCSSWFNTNILNNQLPNDIFLNYTIPLKKLVHKEPSSLPLHLVFYHRENSLRKH